MSDFNSPVHKGQLVAEIDPPIYEAQLQQARAIWPAARADVTLKQQNLERKKVLVPLKAASQLDLDQATAELAQSEAAVTIKEAALHSSQANLGYCKITLAGGWHRDFAQGGRGPDGDRRDDDAGAVHGGPGHHQDEYHAPTSPRRTSVR